MTHLTFRMKKTLLATLLIVIMAFSAQAQSSRHSYTTALGVKAYPTGVTLKHFMTPNTAVEGIAYFYNYGFRVTALYEIHGNFSSTPGLKWYIGPGVHAGFWNTAWKDRYPGRENGVTLGIDGVLGLDYKFNNVPINMSLDWQPSINLTGYGGFDGGWGGLAVRYTF